MSKTLRWSLVAWTMWSNMQTYHHGKVKQLVIGGGKDNAFKQEGEMSAGGLEHSNTTSTHMARQTFVTAEQQWHTPKQETQTAIETEQMTAENTIHRTKRQIQTLSARSIKFKRSLIPSDADLSCHTQHNDTDFDECFFYAKKGYPRNRVAKMASTDDENEPQKYQKKIKKIW